jgi:hypothetical protein
MRDGGGEQRVDRPFHRALDDLAGVVGGGVEFPAFGSVAIDPAFDAAEDVFEKHRVGAGPAAPEAAEDGGDEEQHETGAADGEEEDPHVLREQGDAEHVEAAVFDVEEQRGRAVDGDPR